MQYLTVIMILVLITLDIYATEKVSFEKFCQSNSCRKNLLISLKKKDGTIYENRFKLLPPVIQPSFISIYAGEVIYIEAEEGEEAPKNLVQVEKIKHPEKTIIIKLEQKNDVGDGTSMLLTIQNPWSKVIYYKMSMMLLDGDKFLHTSSCPVIAKGHGYEHWSFPIFQILITNIHFLKNNNGECK